VVVAVVVAILAAAALLLLDTKRDIKWHNYKQQQLTIQDL